MLLQQEKTADAGKEKHVPVIEKSPAGIMVKVGPSPTPKRRTILLSGSR